MKSIIKSNKKAQANLLIGLLIMYMVIAVFVALLPGLRDMIIGVSGYANDGLNCAASSDYNASKTAGSTTACLGLSLFIPFIVLTVLLAIVTKLLYDKGGAPTPQYYGQ